MTRPDPAFTWHFPLPRTHTGLLLGNGTLGAMIWGGGRTLNLTIGRADFWDHRGGIEWTAAMNYRDIRACLDRGDQASLQKMFSKPPAENGQPDWPTVLPLGRVELVFPEGCELRTGHLDTRRGVVTLVVATAAGGTGAVSLVMDMDQPVLALRTDGVSPEAIRRVPAWDYVKERLSAISFAPPERFGSEIGDGTFGWVQARPADPPLCLACRRDAVELRLTAVYGENAAAARAAAAAALAPGRGRGFDALRRRTGAWWRRYWARVPSVDIPNARLAFLYEYGMYKFAGLTNPAGVPATLQGPWIEEYQMPPWSSDYHFNINVQMCYWPAYHGNCVEHLRPIFDLVLSWLPRLRRNAQLFLGIDDGIMLPHAVSDQGICIGGYWAGSLDHGCTAWVAQMMYRYVRYTLDVDFLREKAYPFMVGAMRVYQAMLEEKEGVLGLPVSVSPEYISRNGTLWGPNASFQFACIHRLAEDLVEAAGRLGVEPDPAWADMLQRLPKACVIDAGREKRIGIWQGMDLEVSHRHHSHLAGITPFDILHEDDPEWRPILHASLNRWIHEGPGLWSGWCVPWAAMIHTRFNQGAAAELLLESWERVFTNEGHGTLHDAHIPGFTLMGISYGGTNGANIHRRSGEIMQIEAGMSATTAIQEMLLHTRKGVTHVFAGTPSAWRDASFNGMLTDGAFVVSAGRVAGQTSEVRVESRKGGTFRLANPWGETPVEVIGTGGKPGAFAGAVLEIPMAPGETVRIRPR